MSGTNTTSTNSCEGGKWYYFLASSLITLAGGLVVIIIYRLVLYLCCQGKSGQRKSSIITPNTAINKDSSKEFKEKSQGLFKLKGHDPEVGWLTEAKDWAGELISGQTTTGRILVRAFVLLKHGVLSLFLPSHSVLFFLLSHSVLYFYHPSLYSIFTIPLCMYRVG